MSTAAVVCEAPAIPDTVVPAVAGGTIAATTVAVRTAAAAAAGTGSERDCRPSLPCSCELPS